MSENYSVSSIDEEFTSEIKYQKLVSDRGAPLLPKKFVFKHQREAIKWMEEREKEKIFGVRGGILSFDPGLGKTLTYLILTLISAKKTSTLIVVPKTLISSTISLIKNFFGNRLSFLVFHPEFENEDVKNLSGEKLSSVDFCITTYDVLVKYSTDYLEEIYVRGGGKEGKILEYRLPSHHDRNPKKKGYNLLYNIYWDRIIAEEAHNHILNTKTSQFRSFMALCAINRWVVTGSCVTNKTSDFWSLIHVLGYTEISSPQMWKRSGSKIFETRNLGRFLFRKTYQDCNVKMPELMTENVKVFFPKEQILEYNKQLVETRSEIKKFEDKRTDYTNVLAKFTSLRIYCSQNEQKFCKIPTLVPKGKKCIIFSSFVKSLENLSEYLEKKGHEVFMLYSKTKERSKTISEFEESDSQFLLSSYKVGGVGLNLQFIEYCIFLEPYWNDSTHLQALHRCWRIGQENNVKVFRLCMDKSLEENIYLMCEQKKNTAENLYNGSVQDNISKLGVESIKTLIC